MLPKIEKLTIEKATLLPAAKLELKLINMQKITVNGFKFMIRHNRCVAVGKNTKNDFDLISAAAEIQEHARKLTGIAPDKFRFAFNA